MAVIAAQPGLTVTLISAGTNGNGDVICPPNVFSRHQILIEGSAGVATGAIQVETTNDPVNGVWAPVGGGPVTVVASVSIDINFIGMYPALRARVSTTVTGGTVTTRYTGS